jgi:hypothetical protein
MTRRRTPDPHRAAAMAGRRDAPASYHVDIVICCARWHELMTFSRSTLPGSEDEGVYYSAGSRGRFTTMLMDSQGPDWRQIELVCGFPVRPSQVPCGCHVEIGRARLEGDLTAMWSPGAKLAVRRRWDISD